MSNKTFHILLYTVLALCLAVTLVHLIYDVYAYQHSSIIYFIAEELW